MLDPDLRIRFVYRGAAVSLTRYACHKRDPALGPAECQAGHVVAFPVEGVFVRHRGGRSVVADPNHAVFFSDGDEYRTSHPHGCGDRGVAIVIEEPVLREILAEVAPSHADEPRLLFPAEVSAVDRYAAFVRHSIFQLVEADRRANALGIEEMSLLLVASLLERCPRREAAGGRRPSTRLEHRRLVNDVQGLLTTQFSEPISLEEIARRVHSSPCHLARVFREVTGFSIHQYRLSLRLNCALGRIQAGEDCLATLARDLGFSSHSHLTTAFRQRFGITPSEARRGPYPDLLEQARRSLGGGRGDAP